MNYPEYLEKCKEFEIEPISLEEWLDQKEAIETDEAQDD